MNERRQKKIVWGAVASGVFMAVMVLLAVIF